MRTLLFNVLLLIVMSNISLKGQQLEYSVDLINLTDDRIKVELICPGPHSDVTLFCFPAIIPGHHFWVNYGRFIDSLKAYNSYGSELEVIKKGINDFQINDSEDLHIITYLVNDTKDSDQDEKVMGWSETNFVENKVFVVNPGGVFGYIKGMENMPVQINFSKPLNLYGSTAMKCTARSDSQQAYEADNYHQLVDCPILFAAPDTADLFVGNSRITVACYNQSGEKSAPYIADLIKPEMEAVAEFTGGSLPVDNYVFIYYLRDYSEEADLFYDSIITGEAISRRIINKHGIPMLGALEHSNSSFHNLVYVGKNKLTDHLLTSSAVHEFLHIYTPLNLRSDVRANFNYSEPNMSKHLWLYEGVTEYLSDMVLLKGKLIDPGSYLNYDLRMKILISNQYPDDMVFTEMSEKIFEEPYKSQFIQVYNRGAILAMILDLEIIRLTEGKLNLSELIFKLTRKYGKENPFKEDSFINELVEMVHPDLMIFFDSYIRGSEPLDYKTPFNTIGIDFVEEEKTLVPESILAKGFGVEDVIEFFGFYTINEADSKSPFKPGDKILSSDFGYNCLKPFINNKGEFIKEGESAEIPVYRNGKWIKLELRPEEFKPEVFKYKIGIKDKMSPLQERLFKVWIAN